MVEIIFHQIYTTLPILLWVDLPFPIDVGVMWFPLTNGTLSGVMRAEVSNVLVSFDFAWCSRDLEEPSFWSHDIGMNTHRTELNPARILKPSPAEPQLSRAAPPSPQECPNKQAHGQKDKRRSLQSANTNNNNRQHSLILYCRWGPGASECWKNYPRRYVLTRGWNMVWINVFPIPTSLLCLNYVFF